jgi:hypothetical protein
MCVDCYGHIDGLRNFRQMAAADGNGEQADEWWDELTDELDTLNLDAFVDESEF